MYVLGISAFYHDSAACLLADGVIVAAAQEERFSRVKHDAGFPSLAVAFCLKQARISIDDVDLVAFYEKPLARFDRLIETQLAYVPLGFANARRVLPTWLREKLHHGRLLDQGLGLKNRRYVWVRHHDAHAASAFFPSPFPEAAILTADGVGEWTTASIAHGRGAKIESVAEQRFPHSLGLLYSACTAFCGFRVNNGEYKLMGLAPYGEPTFASRIRDELLEIRPDGSFRLNMRYFGFCYSDSMFTPELERLFDGPPREYGGELTQRHLNIARSVQLVTEEVMLAMAQHARETTGSKQLVMAGGVALNCVANGRVQREAGFDEVWVQPAAGDAGGALGAAAFVWHQLLGHERTSERPDAQRGSLLGPEFSPAEVREAVRARGLDWEEFDSEGSLDSAVAELLATGNVVGHFGGRAEFGPRALGARSILGDPRDAAMQEVMNLKIKFRESFRPFAPAVLAERAQDYFETSGHESPYMLVVSQLSASRLLATEGAEGLAKLKQKRSELPAITHVDGSARVQTVTVERAPRLRAILEAFEQRTGTPVLVNTSFNVRGEPIVNTPDDAIDCFLSTNIDAIVLEDVLVRKPDGAAEVSEPSGDPEATTGGGHSHLIDFDLHPPESKLARFGFVALAVFGVASWAALNGHLWFGGLGHSARVPVAGIFGVLAGVSAAFSVAWPKGNRALWVVLSVLTYPIGFVVSWLVLGLVFFGVLTPLGVALRLFGHDPLKRASSSEAESYWTELETLPSKRYFRQY